MVEQAYLRAVHRYDLLDKEQERKIAIKAKGGDLRARDQLINSNLRLVIHLARKYSKNGHIDDMIQEGNIGLLKAFEKYEPDLGNKFSTYANWWIKQGIHRYRSKIKSIRISSNNTISRIFNIITEYLSENPRRPTDAYIAEELNKYSDKVYKPRDIDKILQDYDNAQVTSLDATVGDDETDFMYFIPGNDGRELLEKMASESVAEVVYDQINELRTNSLTKKVLKEVLFYDKKLDEVMSEFGLKREKVRQTYEKGRRQLRSCLLKNDKFTRSVVLTNL